MNAHIYASRTTFHTLILAVTMNLGKFERLALRAANGTEMAISRFLKCGVTERLYSVFVVVTAAAANFK